MFQDSATKPESPLRLLSNASTSLVNDGSALVPRKNVAPRVALAYPRTRNPQLPSASQAGYLRRLDHDTGPGAVPGLGG
jgi:hypothetical protein